MTLYRSPHDHIIRKTFRAGQAQGKDKRQEGSFKVGKKTRTKASGRGRGVQDEEEGFRRVQDEDEGFRFRTSGQEDEASGQSSDEQSITQIDSLEELEGLDHGS